MLKPINFASNEDVEKVVNEIDTTEYYKEESGWVKDEKEKE